MAIDKSRTKTNLIDTSVLLKEEKVMFEAMTSLFDNYREAVLFSVLNEKIPFTQGLESFNLAKSTISEFKSASEPQKKDTKLVRFMSHIPKFVGPELEEYGPFEEEDIANLPNEIADLLIGKGKAEEINEE